MEAPRWGPSCWGLISVTAHHSSSLISPSSSRPPDPFPSSPLLLAPSPAECSHPIIETLLGYCSQTVSCPPPPPVPRHEPWYLNQFWQQKWLPSQPLLSGSAAHRLDLIKSVRCNRSADGGAVLQDTRSDHRTSALTQATSSLMSNVTTAFRVFSERLWSVWKGSSQSQHAFWY